MLQKTDLAITGAVNRHRLEQQKTDARAVTWRDGRTYTSVRSCVNVSDIGLSQLLLAGCLP